MSDIDRRTVLTNTITAAASVGTAGLPTTSALAAGETPLFTAYRSASAAYTVAIEASDAAGEPPDLRRAQEAACEELFRCVYALLERPCQNRGELLEAATVYRAQLFDEGAPITADRKHSSNSRMEAALLRCIFSYCGSAAHA